MNKTIIKFHNAIVALIVIILSGVGAFASTPWTVNPSDYRYDMSLYLDVQFTSSEIEKDYSLYDFAVFCGDECRGIAEVLSLGNGSECLYMRVRSNVESGEKLVFKYCDKASGEIPSIEEQAFTFESNGRLGYPSTPYVITITRLFNVVVTAGEGGSVDNAGGTYPEGTELTLTATPAIGHSFTQWNDGSYVNPRTIDVDADITLTAEFEVNSYKLTYTLDGVTYNESQVDYGTTLTAIDEPQKEGYTFSGWQGLPQTMPAEDIVVTGTFTINTYNAVFKVDGNVVATVPTVFGNAIQEPEAPQKEGHTFAGWQNVPETMPANDVEIIGSYTVNSYKLTYTLDGVTYNESQVNYGTTLTAIDEPQKEGYTFSGWQGLPQTMPAEDIVVTGTFIINSYTLTIYLNGEVYSSEEYEYGTELNIETPEVPTGYKFDGWEEDELPATMPAHDVDLHGIYIQDSGVGIDDILSEGETIDVYSLQGILIAKNLSRKDFSKSLRPGFYIVNGKKILIL